MPLLLIPILKVVHNTLDKGGCLPVSFSLEDFAVHDQVYIGRALSCKVRIPSLLLCPVHAVIKRKKTKKNGPLGEGFSYFLVDHSKTGLSLNTHPVERCGEVEIKHGDVIDLLPSSEDSEDSEDSEGGRSSSTLRVMFETVGPESDQSVVQQGLKAELEETKTRLTTLEKRVADLEGDNARLRTELDLMMPPQEQEAKLLCALEREWTCVICDGVFIAPSSLGCGHTFCTHCLLQWFSKKEECPICREPCVGMNKDPKKNVVIAAMIERAYGDLISSSVLRKARAHALKEREEEVRRAQ